MLSQDRAGCIKTIFDFLLHMSCARTEISVVDRPLVLRTQIVLRQVYTLLRVQVDPCRLASYNFPAINTEGTNNKRASLKQYKI